MPEVLAYGEHYAEFGADDPPQRLPELKAEVKALCGGHVRRIDRLIQLALVGSARCVAGRSLPAGCGIYLGSGLGTVGSTSVLQEQIFRFGVLPKPAEFINTLSNTAGFYVARNLGLDGQCLFATRDYTSFEAVVELATVDLDAGRVPAALVGVVDECTLPLEQHARRLHREHAPVLAEGSHWLLLGPDGDGGPAAGRISCPQPLRTAELPRWCERLAAAGDATPTWWWQAPDLGTVDAVAAVAASAGWRPWPGRAGEFPLRSAAATLSFLQAGGSGRLLLVNADRCDRVVVTELLWC